MPMNITTGARTAILTKFHVRYTTLDQIAYLKYKTLNCFADNLSRARLRPNGDDGSEYINASFIDVNYYNNN